MNEFKTFSVSPLIDESGAPAYLANKLTEKIRNYFQQNTRMILVKQNGDLMVDGRITKYATAPNAIGSDSRATSNRLTVTVAITAYNNIKSQNILDNQSFEKFREYPVDTPLPSVESNLNEEIANLLVVEIFNGIFTW
ncbi:MAG TPA: LptE family protein [Cytophagales bacterium]|nr:LptE family protein [Cytophagales bacterium]